jgi:hypothetical protein
MMVLAVMWIAPSFGRISHYTLYMTFRFNLWFCPYINSILSTLFLAPLYCRRIFIKKFSRLPNKTEYTWCLTYHFMDNVTVWFGAQEDVMTSVLQLYANRHSSVQNSLNNWFGKRAECISRPRISVTWDMYLHPTHVVSSCMLIDKQNGSL